MCYIILLNTLNQYIIFHIVSMKRRLLLSAYMPQFCTDCRWRLSLFQE